MQAHLLVAWAGALLLFCFSSAVDANAAFHGAEEGCTCKLKGEQLDSWLRCIGLSQEETARLQGEGWKAGDFADMSVEEAVSSLPLSDRVRMCIFDGCASCVCVCVFVCVCVCVCIIYAGC